MVDHSLDPAEIEVAPHTLGLEMTHLDDQGETTVGLLGRSVGLVADAPDMGAEVHLQASWTSTANDIKVNALVIVAAIVIGFTASATSDLIAGALIFVIVARGAQRIRQLTARPASSSS